MNERQQNRLGESSRLVPILALAVITAALIADYLPGKSCTIFTAVQGETVLYGNSEDQHNPDPVIGFFPPAAGNYGSVHFGIIRPDGQYNFEGAVNDQGLAWDCNSTPKARLDPDPEKPYFLGDKNFLTRITKEAATVEEAIRIARFYQFGETLKGQYHIADASGDAVVISGGPDGKIAFTRKEPGDGYLLSTNFNLAQPENGPVDYRWYTAAEMLGAVENGADLTPAAARDLLEAVHLKTLTSYTLYSNVLDLKEKLIYLNYMAQFNETAVIVMEEEFAKGPRVVEMREFFSPETTAAGDAAYRRFALRFKAAIAGVLTAAVSLTLAAVVGVVRLVRKKSRYQVPH